MPGAWWQAPGTKRPSTRLRAGLSGDRCGVCYDGPSGPIAVYELLEFRMEKIRPELVTLHFAESPLCVPAILLHAIDRCHDARTMSTALAVDIDRLLRGVVHDLEKLGELLLCGWDVRGHRNSVELHPR